MKITVCKLYKYEKRFGIKHFILIGNDFAMHIKFKFLYENKRNI